MLSKRITLEGSHVVATVRWDGPLPHVLVWEELGKSAEDPWNREVRALGIEPTTTGHGAGTTHDDELVSLEPGGELRWSTSLDARWREEGDDVSDR